MPSTTTKATTTTTKPVTTTTKATTTTTKLPSTTTTAASTAANIEAKTEETTEEGEDDEVLKASEVGTLRVCPGVCVATRISDYCEAVLNVDGLCKTAMKCCVTKSLFGDSEPPPELVILNDGANASPSSTQASTTTTTTTTTTTVMINFDSSCNSRKSYVKLECRRDQRQQLLALDQNLQLQRQPRDPITTSAAKYDVDSPMIFSSCLLTNLFNRELA